MSTLIQNSEKKPLTSSLDLSSFFNLPLGSYNAQLYFNISNLFNRLNNLNVYNDSGVAHNTNYLQDALEQNTGQYVNSIEKWYKNETYYSNPRRIEIGVKYDF